MFVTGYKETCPRPGDLCLSHTRYQEGRLVSQDLHCSEVCVNGSQEITPIPVCKNVSSRGVLLCSYHKISTYMLKSYRKEILRCQLEWTVHVCIIIGNTSRNLYIWFPNSDIFGKRRSVGNLLLSWWFMYTCPS